MEDAEDFDISIALHKIGDSKVPVQNDANISRRVKIPVAHFRMLSEDLGALVNPLNCTSGCAWIVRRDVLEDVFEPPESLVSPGYLGHDRMRRPISSFEMVRFASESARPRSIMTWNASSRTISSGELSSGWLWIRRVRSSFGVDTLSLRNVHIVP